MPGKVMRRPVMPATPPTIEVLTATSRAAAADKAVEEARSALRERRLTPASTPAIVVLEEPRLVPERSTESLVPAALVISEPAQVAAVPLTFEEDTRTILAARNARYSPTPSQVPNLNKTAKSAPSVLRNTPATPMAMGQSALAGPLPEGQHWQPRPAYRRVGVRT